AAAATWRGSGAAGRSSSGPFFPPGFRSNHAIEIGSPYLGRFCYSIQESHCQKTEAGRPLRSHIELRKVDSLLVFSKTRHRQDPSLSTSSYRFDTGGISICIQNLADSPLGRKNIFF